MTVKIITGFSFSAEAESVKDLGHSCVVIVTLSYIIGLCLKTVIRIFYRASDSCGKDHGKVIFSISRRDGIFYGNLIMIRQETEGCSFADSGRNDLQQIGIGIKTAQLTCKLSLKETAKFSDPRRIVIIKAQELERRSNVE